MMDMSMLERIKRQIITQAEEPVMFYELNSMTPLELTVILKRAFSDPSLESSFGSFDDDWWGSDIHEYCEDRKLHLLGGWGEEDEDGYREAYIVESFRSGYEGQIGVIFFPWQNQVKNYLYNQLLAEDEEYAKEMAEDYAVDEDDGRIICLKMFKKHKTRIADFDAYRRLNKAAYRRRNRKSHKK